MPRQLNSRASKWLSALREYNKDKDVWTVPRKGTESYKEVRAIYESM